LIDSAPEGKKPIEVLRNNDIQDMVDTIIKYRKNITREGKFSIVYGEKAILINGAPVIKEGVVQGAILVFHDITEIRRLERVRQDFVANVSHELRTPLSNIKGYAETLLDGAISDEANSREFTQIIYRESERLSNIIDDLLDISRMESGKIKMVFLPIEAEGAIKKAIAVLKNSTIGKSISIELSIQDNLPKILADEGRLTQVLLNLLDNAVKYTADQGSIIVSAFKKDDFVQIEVKDTGIGIPEKDLARIFERFYRVDKARSRDLGGTGLGLSIVKHIVQAHKGEVWVASTQGKGSIFSFTIPAI
jgi:two-component system phosphate regulon sensor histidine kinase PhoR